ncbi:porin [Mycetohabitans sp. B5]|uniref:Putative porin n=1 Tax=Mycetohabitans endofungorum TaxID=417203 RepID=A0A2P5KBW3_9BURK|nr:MULTISPECIES: porin [Mycetohabitans]MCG1054477.1 porin [Mycetohabitans sp. B5]PPB84196.1 putative porin [Mycetohabitans endofungorum]
MKKRAMTIVAFSGLAANAAWAQSNVTLYGAVDNGIGYQTSQTAPGSINGGRSAIKMAHGVWLGNRIGFKGDEDLGGGLKALFTLEAGFNGANGDALFEKNAQFGRQAFVGMAHPEFGTVTAGRQYTAYYTLLAPYSPTTWLTAYGSHPGDISSLNMAYRTNSSIVYMSPNLNGLKFGGSYAFAGVPGSAYRGSTWSAGVQYINGPFGIAAGFQRVNNAAVGGGEWDVQSATNSNGKPPVSAINYGYQTAQAQQRVGVTGGWKFTPDFDVSLSYTNTQYVPGILSRFHNQATFNAAGVALHWKPSPVWDLAAGYNHARASKANGIEHAARYNQFNLSQYYSLSKRTGIYMVQAYQRASGNTFTVAPDGTTGVVKATASIGDAMNAAPSSSQSQFAAAAGIVHRF